MSKIEKYFYMVAYEYLNLRLKDNEYKKNFISKYPNFRSYWKYCLHLLKTKKNWYERAIIIHSMRTS